MKLFLDTADVAVIKDLLPTGMVDGVTTNPSLIAKSGRNIAEVIAEICALVEGPISAEAVATDFETMVKEGDKLAAIAPNVVVKLPLTWDGLRATRAFADKGVKTNVTMLYGSIETALREFGEEGRRKALLILSDGEHMPPPGSESRATVRSASMPPRLLRSCV